MGYAYVNPLAGLRLHTKGAGPLWCDGLFLRQPLRGVEARTYPPVGGGHIIYIWCAGVVGDGVKKDAAFLLQERHHLQR